jgi:hypothetical protein
MMVLDHLAFGDSPVDLLFFQMPASGLEVRLSGGLGAHGKQGHLPLDILALT